MNNNKNSLLIKEACVDSFDQARKAEMLGANRLEICKDLHLDGLTPKIDVVNKIIKEVSIPIKVMIRPRSGNFVYNEFETLKMEQEINQFKSIGVKEFVIGALTKTNTIDTEKINRLCSKIYPLTSTFHKAIDYTQDPINQIKSLSKFKEIGSILTSGGKKTAFEGKYKLNEIIKKFGNRFHVIAAGSITDKNLGLLKNEIYTNEFHGKAIVGSLKSSR